MEVNDAGLRHGDEVGGGEDLGKGFGARKRVIRAKLTGTTLRVGDDDVRAGVEVVAGSSEVFEKGEIVVNDWFSLWGDF